MSEIGTKTMNMLHRIGVSGTTFIGFYPTIDRKTPASAPLFAEPDEATNWALGYLTGIEDLKAEQTTPKQTAVVDEYAEFDKWYQKKFSRAFGYLPDNNHEAACWLGWKGHASLVKP